MWFLCVAEEGHMGRKVSDEGERERWWVSGPKRFDEQGGEPKTTPNTQKRHQAT
jgi:hypothetical protein